MMLEDTHIIRDFFVCSSGEPIEQCQVGWIQEDKVSAEPLKDSTIVHDSADSSTWCYGSKGGELCRTLEVLSDKCCLCALSFEENIEIRDPSTDKHLHSMIPTAVYSTRMGLSR